MFSVALIGHKIATLLNDKCVGAGMEVVNLYIEPLQVVVELMYAEMSGVSGNKALYFVLSIWINSYLLCVQWKCAAGEEYFIFWT